MRAQLLAWQPFPSPLYRLDFFDGHVQAFAMDAEAVNAVPSGAAIWPEGLLHAAGTDGLRLVRCIEGVEGQCWAAGQLRASRWWRDEPSDTDWQAFCRAVQQPDVALPAAEELPWQRPVRPISGLEDLGQRLRGQERLLGGAIALALFGGTGFVAHGAWDAWQARARAVAGVEALRDGAAPMLSARDRAQSDAAKAGALTKLLDAASPLEVLNHLGQALPKDARLKEFELQADTGRATIELPPDATRGKLIADLEAGGWFTRVAEAKEATGRAGITLEWKLSANRAPNQPGTDAGLKRAAADLASSPPGVQIDPPKPPVKPAGGKP